MVQLDNDYDRALVVSPESIQFDSVSGFHLLLLHLLINKKKYTGWDWDILSP